MEEEEQEKRRSRGGGCQTDREGRSRVGKSGREREAGEEVEVKKGNTNNCIKSRMRRRMTILEIQKKDLTLSKWRGVARTEGY